GANGDQKRKGVTMEDLTSQVFYCERWEDIVRKYNAVIKTLPTDVRKRFSEAFLAFLQKYEMEEVYERLNNRTIGSILAEYDAMEVSKPIASGEKDGVSWALYDPPSPKPGAKKPPGGE